MKTNIKVDGVIGRVQFGLIGDLAMFTRPESKISGNPISYMIPTHEAIRGIMKKIYWHPKPFEIDYNVVAVRVMNNMYNFETIQYSYATLEEDKNNILVTGAYLKNVHYQIIADIVYKDGLDHGMSGLIKAEHIFNNRVKHETPYDSNMYFGTAECGCYLLNEKFGDGDSFYDDSGHIEEIESTNMFIRFDHLDDFRNGHKTAYFGNVTMDGGIVRYPAKNACRKINIK